MAKEAQHKVTPYIICDFEAGGRDVRKNAITEIAMLAIKGDTLEEIGRYDALLAPYDDDLTYENEALEKTGLSIKKLEAEGLKYDDFMSGVIEFLKKANVHNSTTGYKPVIVAHNAIFEVKSFQHLFNRPLQSYDLSKYLHGDVDYFGNFQPAYIDTIHLAKLIWNAHVRQKQYTLEAVCERAGIAQADGHRAMADVIPTSEFFKMAIKMLRGAGSAGSKVEEELAFRSNFKFQF